MIDRRVVLFVVCVYILRSIRSADYVELPVFSYLLQCLVYHMLSKMKRGSGICIRAGPAVKLTFRVPAIKFEPLGAQCYLKHCWNRPINARMHNHVSLLQSRSQRLETSRHHIVLDLEKVKPLFFLFLFCGAIFKFGFASQSPHVTLVLPQTQHATKRANQAAMAANLCT